MTTQDIIQLAGNLPASHIAERVNETLHAHSALVITAPPGAGKSTLLPLTIHTAQPGKILMLEPRRLAARQIAERMASILGEPVGKTVGYRVRFESKVSQNTHIEVLTEGILTRMLIDDATLEGVSTIIFDEFHERSINSDLALALTRQAQQIIRPDLKIVIMSATIDASTICQALHAPLIESEGKMYDVETHYADQDMSPYDVAQSVAATVLKAYRQHEGDILAFLPGQGEIQKCELLLSDSSIPCPIYPLYGNLPIEKQHQAIAPSPQGERKIVLATPIAETSLTIEGVRIVVDSGLCRKMVYDDRTGLSHLATVRISQDMATQRRGRARRVAEGVCYRLWTLTSNHLLQEQRKPEIEEADLASLVLDIAAFGERDVYQMPWLTMPPKGKVTGATLLLASLGALTDAADLSSITILGRQMAAMPCHPRIAKMMLTAMGGAQKALACDIAALLEEKDPLSAEFNTDMALRITILRSSRSKKDLGKWARIAKIASEYRRLMGDRDVQGNTIGNVKEDNQPVDANEIGYLLACAYPERIAMSIDHIGTYRLASGDIVRLDAQDPLIAQPWLVIASLNTSNSAGNMQRESAHASSAGRVFLASTVDSDMLPSILYDNISWDRKQGCVVMQQERRIGKLIIDAKPIQHADNDQIVDIICEAIKKDGLSMLNWSDNVKRLQLRVAQVAAWHPELDIPDLSTEHLMQTATQWLPFYLKEGDKVKSSSAELKRIDLQEVLWNSLPYELQQEIDLLAPTHIQVPSGSKIRIDYRMGAEAPVLSVRLQECFGMGKTPCVDNGKQPLLVELLSPGFKPVQLTQDLPSFWQGTYFEVRKELKRRYPKHYWPENPLEAEATRGVKRKKQ